MEPSRPGIALTSGIGVQVVPAGHSTKPAGKVPERAPAAQSIGASDAGTPDGEANGREKGKETGRLVGSGRDTDGVESWRASSDGAARGRETGRLEIGREVGSGSETDGTES